MSVCSNYSPSYIVTKMSILTFLLTAALLVAASPAQRAAQAGDKITLDVYIEALCPDCHAFVIQQLGPQYELISSFADVRIIPFGNAEFEANAEGGYTFKCQHGPEECEGNMLLSCVNRYSNSTSQAMDFTVCLMRYPKLPSKCANSAGLDYKVLNACLNGPEGEELLHQNGVETLSLVPEHLGVPWIVFNKVWDAQYQDSAEEDLKATACKLAPEQTAACQ